VNIGSDDHLGELILGRQDAAGAAESLCLTWEMLAWPVMGLEGSAAVAGLLATSKALMRKDPLSPCFAVLAWLTVGSQLEA